MATNFGLSGTASGDKSSVNSVPNTQQSSGGNASIGDSSARAFNQGIHREVFLGGSGDTNITAALIYAGLAEQNKLLKDVGTQEAHMYIKRIQVYGLHPGFYISMAPTTVPGKAFMPAMQIYDMGIEGSSQANLTHRWPGDITINNPVDVANTNAVCLITADNAAGSDSEWYAFVSVSLHSNLTVPFTELTPAILIAGGAQADVLNQKSRSAFSKKRRTETTLALSIAKIRKLQMPVIDNVQ